MELPGHVLEVVDSLPSTNTEVRRRIMTGQARAGLVLVAREQTAGRGRADHRWFGAPGRSLAVTSVHLLPRLARTSRLTILAAIAACRALDQLGVTDTTIKWPNDLMRGERKVGGLLAEIVRSPDGTEHLVLGLGLNLRLEPGDLPDDVAPRAGAVGLVPDEATRQRLLVGFVTELDAALAELGTNADEDRGAEYRQRSWLSGRQVTLRWDGRTEAVAIADVTSEGDLVFADGRIAPGEHVQVVPDDPAVG